ncbi:MAG: hypothetical protein AAF846_26190 [Chloroflexota bacterium]
MQKIGTVTFVQIQREPLKLIQNPDNTYDDRIYRPQLIERVEHLKLTPQGIIGVGTDGKEVIDVHNETHPQTRYRGDNQLSFGFLQHYECMRERFGDHIRDGDGGENIVLDADIDLVKFVSFGKRFFFKRDSMTIEIVDVIPAPPCRPFSVYCANQNIHGKELKSALQFLDNGTRGYYGKLVSEGDNLTIQAGDTLWMA